MSTNHYVDNKQLYSVLVEHREKVKAAKKANLPLPRVPEYVGKCFLLIAERLSSKPNFANYPYREEMVSDGIENCIIYINNFNPEKSANPFAYFTQIIYYAFLRRIHKEKRQLYIKHKVFEKAFVDDELFDASEFADDAPVHGGVMLENEKMQGLAKNFEEGLSRRRAKRKQGLEKFLEDTTHAEDESHDSHGLAGLGEEFEGSDDVPFGEGELLPDLEGS